MNEELKAQFNGDEARMKDYANQKGVRLELARRGKKFAEKLKLDSVEVPEGRVCEYSSVLLRYWHPRL